MHLNIISIFFYCVTLLSIYVNVLYIMIFFNEANKDYYYYSVPKPRLIGLKNIANHLHYPFRGVYLSDFHLHSLLENH